MKERPIIMSSESVQAILAGRKTQTRRVCTTVKKPPYMPGDRLWVKESYVHCPDILMPNHQRKGVTRFRADGDNTTIDWRNPMFMPKKYSRITLEVVNVFLSQLRAMSILDFMAEGYPGTLEQAVQKELGRTACEWWYIRLWEKLNKKRGYPFYGITKVWVIDFRRIEKEAT